MSWKGPAQHDCMFIKMGNNGQECKRNSLSNQVQVDIISQNSTWAANSDDCENLTKDMAEYVDQEEEKVWKPENDLEGGVELPIE